MTKSHLNKPCFFSFLFCVFWIFEANLLSAGEKTAYIFVFVFACSLDWTGYDEKFKGNMASNSFQDMDPQFSYPVPESALADDWYGVDIKYLVFKVLLIS